MRADGAGLRRGERKRDETYIHSLHHEAEHGFQHVDISDKSLEQTCPRREMTTDCLGVVQFVSKKKQGHGRQNM